MKRLIIRTTNWIADKLLSKQQKERLVLICSSLLGVSLLESAYKSIGILKYQNYKVSGEEFIMKNTLPKVTEKSKQVFFDIGANEGGYSRLLLEHFPKAEIYSFEPVVDTYNALVNSMGHTQNVKCFNIGLGARQEVVDIYTYDAKDNNKHASVYSNVIADLHHAYDDVKSYTIAIDTLDEFCAKQGINDIDFVKIDTEGHELSVLKGADGLLKDGRIKAIQFEFNEMNIVSRVFLKDFHDFLRECNYDLYRMDEKRLIDLRSYRSRNEIFAFQNILAVRNDIEI